jgi:hypothetical protein
MTLAKERALYPATDLTHEEGGSIVVPGVATGDRMLHSVRRRPPVHVAHRDQGRTTLRGRLIRSDSRATVPLRTDPRHAACGHRSVLREQISRVMSRHCLWRQDAPSLLA